MLANGAVLNKADFLIVPKRVGSQDFTKANRKGMLALATGGYKLNELRLVMWFMSTMDFDGLCPLVSQSVLADQLGTSQSVISVSMGVLINRGVLQIISDEKTGVQYYQLSPGVAMRGTGWKVS